jgi:hypothetical protein
LFLFPFQREEKERGREGREWMGGVWHVIPKKEMTYNTLFQIVRQSRICSLSICWWLIAWQWWWYSDEQITCGTTCLIISDISSAGTRVSEIWKHQSAISNKIGRLSISDCDYSLMVTSQSDMFPR